ncbi:MAG TPA: hypothetical protein HPP76_02620 [Desulfuromonadales bacterium]|nr:hypothetical protein [Desulfuromonadales bacterium]
MDIADTDIAGFSGCALAYKGIQRIIPGKRIDQTAEKWDFYRGWHCCSRGMNLLSGNYSTAAAFCSISLSKEINSALYSLATWTTRTCQLLCVNDISGIQMLS